MTVQQGLYNNALESTGALEEANSVKAQSIEGKMNTLKTTVNEMWANMINSDSLKGGIDALTNLVEVFGNLPTVIGLATTAFLVFKGTAISSSLATLNLGASLGKLKVKLMGNPLGLFAVALTTIITLMVNAETATDRLEKSLSKMKEAQTTLSDMKDTSKVVSQYEELEDKINSGTLSTEEMTTAKKDLVTMQETLAKTFPSIIDGFNNEGDAIVTNLDKVNEKIKETNENSLNDMKSAYNTAFKSITEDDQTMWEEIKNAKDGLYQDADVMKKVDPSITIDNGGLYWGGGNFTGIEKYKYFLELQKEGVTLTEKQQEEYKKVVNNIDEANKLTYTMYQMGGDIEGYQIVDKTTGELQNAEEYYKTITDGADDSTKKNEELNTKIKEQQELLKKKYDVSTASEDYTKSLAEQQKIVDLQNQINESGKVTPSIIQSALDLYPQMGSAVFDVATLQEYLNNKVSEQETKQKEAYANMMQGDEDFFANKIKNTSNYETFQATVLSNLQQLQIKGFQSNADGMKTELNNAKTLGQARTAVESKVIDANMRMWAEYYSALASAEAKWTDANGVTLNDAVYDSRGQVTSKYKDIVAQHNKQRDAIIAMQKAAQSLSGGIDIITPSFSSTDFSNSGKGSSGSSSTAKEVEDIKDLIDIYYDLQNAMDVLSARQTYLKTTREGTFGKEYLANLQQELVLLDKQQKAVSNMATGIRNERWDLMRDLENNWGFTFGSQGEVTNYKTRLKDLMDYANSLTGETKENFKSALEEVSDKLKNYTDLTINRTNDMSNQWQEYNNQIRETYRLMGEAQQDAEGKISETYKHILQERLDTTKKYIDEIKNKLNTQWDEEEYADQKQVAQQTLLDIRSQINNAVKSGDKELIADLQKQYTEQQKTVNDMIRDHEREQITNKLDKEESKLDEQLAEMLKPENLNQTIQTALQEGYFKIGDEIISVQKSMKNLTEDTVEGFMSQKIALDEYLRSFSTGIEMAKQLGNITSNLGLVSSINNVPVIPSSSYASVNNNANANTIQVNSPLLVIESMDNSLLPQVEGIVNNAINGLAKQIDSQYKI